MSKNLDLTNLQQAAAQKIEEQKTESLTVFITQAFFGKNNQVSICYRFFPKQHPCQNQLSIHWKPTKYVSYSLSLQYCMLNILDRNGTRCTEVLFYCINLKLI